MTENRPIHDAAEPHETGLSRRHFLHCTACATAAFGAGTMAGPAFAAIPQGREVMKEFAYGAVQLTGGPIKAHFDSIHAHYLSLDNDRVLKVFRQQAGLPAPGPDMGGWYDADGFVPGLAFGQYVSGLARIGAATGDRACHAKVAALVHGFGEFLKRVQNPYAGENSAKNWAAYVMDKYVVGLIDAYRLSGVQEARALLPMVIDKCMPFISPVSKDRIGKVNPPWDETYVLSENLFHVADITADDKYRRMAVHYMLDKEWFDPLAAGQDVLPLKHAYSHTIALSSGGQAYLQMGADKYKQALINAWDYMEPQRFASGGWGPEEQFVELHQGKLAASLDHSKAHFETPCGSFADMKLARYLIRLTGGAKYGDGLERTIYNTILATRFPDSDGNYPYYSNYGSAAAKEYYQKKWPCCSGTLVQGVADYVLDVYFHDDSSLLVNMLVPSRVSWARAGGTVVVEQETNFPADDSSRIRVVKPGSGRFDLKVRIPAWAKGARLTVNGRAQPAVPGSHAVISRRWAAGDVVEVNLPQPLRTLPIDDRNPKLDAVMRGPVMYVGLNPWEGVDKQALPLPGGLRPVAGENQTYILPVGEKSLVFVPYHRVIQERYNTYFRTA
jgi:DUF1680 family protein